MIVFQIGKPYDTDKKSKIISSQKYRNSLYSTRGGIRFLRSASERIQVV
jgi:hypothetical protein